MMKGFVPQGKDYEVRRDLQRGSLEGTLGSNVEDANCTKRSYGNNPGDKKREAWIKAGSCGDRRQERLRTF